jgi:hypothetical protein
LHLSKELFFLNSGTTWASFNFSGKMELFIDLFIKFVIGLTIAGFAKNNSLDKCNYRPVSILPTISKFYERAINEQTVTFFDKVFHPSLSAFRSGYGDTLFSVGEKFFYQFQCRFTYSVCI